jgi:hypothetical protein
MAQTYTEDCFAANHAGLTDLQNMEDNFHALKTMFSGSSAPANSTAGMPWFDTAKKILKIRNSTSGAWLGVHYSSTAVRYWAHTNAAEDGWVVDSSIIDRVVGIRGGTGGYNVAGGSTAGSWTISGLSVSTIAPHTHRWYAPSNSTAPDVVFGSSGEWTYLPSTNNAKVAGFGFIPVLSSGSTADLAISANLYVESGGGSSQSISSDFSWRPAAAMGVLQYVDL